MPDLVVETPEGVSLSHAIAGAGSRTAAGLIDLGIFLLGWLLVTSVAVLVTINDPSGLSGFVVGLLVGGMILLPAIYQIAFGILRRGQTPGKILMHLRVVDANGDAATSLQHVLRGLFWPLEAMLLIFPVPFALILMVVTRHSQRLGDLVAGTVVLRERRPTTLGEPFPQGVWSALPDRRLALVPALAARLDARDYRVLRSILRRSDLRGPARDRLHRRAARHYLRRLGMEERIDEAGLEPRRVLRELYMFLRELRGLNPTAGVASPPRQAAGADPGNAPAAEPSPR